MIQTPIDLCLATMRFHPDYSGPAMRFHRYEPGLRKRGIKMRVLAGTPGNGRGFSPCGTSICPSDEKLGNGSLLPLETVDGIPVQRVRTSGGGILRGDLPYLRAMIRYVQEGGQRPDLIQFLSLPLVSAPWLIALGRMEIPIVFVHTMLGELSSRFWKRSLQRLYWRPNFQLMDCVVVSSEVARDNLRGIGVKSRIEVIPNGVALDRFSPVESEGAKSRLRERLELDSDVEVVLFVGPIVARKGVDLLVEAWKSVAPKRPRARLVLVGPRYQDAGVSLRGGPGFQIALEKGIRESGLEDRVVFTGPVDEIEAYYKAADVFVFPSKREGMPNAVLEAFACGLSVILTPFLGLPAEFGRAGEHYVLADRNPGALAEAINGLLADDAQRRSLAHRGRDWVRDHMAVEASLDRFAALYRELVPGSGTVGTARP